MARKRGRGHYCWCCGSYRPDEKFSGHGHARHLCRQCAKLGKEELQYRQACRNLERLVTWEGIIPRRRRAQFRQFEAHEDPRIRELARQLAAADAAAPAAQVAGGPGRTAPMAGQL